MAALLEPELAAGRKVIAFSVHHDVIDALAERFKGQCVTLDGRTSPARRQAAIKAFRESQKIHLFNGQISAAGEVIDLTPCSLMYIFEQDWVPKTLTQAIGRANRPGQIEPLMVWMLTLAGSIDDSLTRTLFRKQSEIKSLEAALWARRNVDRRKHSLRRNTMMWSSTPSFQQSGAEIQKPYLTI
jgi:SNF2 family DNA or RNA helicase